MTHENIKYAEKSRIATITIDRPDKANSCNIGMLQVIHECLEKADKSERIKSIIIKSTGDRFFSAGYDLKEVQGNPENVVKITRWGRKVNSKILLMKKSVIAQVQGIMIGFGSLLVMASDFRIFADRPKDELYFQLPELAISAFPQTGATLLPLLKFGLNYAKHVLFTADKLGIEDLNNLSFITRVVPKDELEEKTIEFAKKINKYQPAFSITAKVMLNIMNKNYIESCLDLEDECGKLAYGEKKSMEEWEEIVQDLYEKYP